MKKALMSFLLLALSAALSACGSGRATDLSSTVSAPKAPIADPQSDINANLEYTIVEKGYATPTNYYIPVHNLDTEKCSTVRFRDLLDPQGKVIINVCTTVYDDCAMQGSCQLKKTGKILYLNYNSTVSGVVRFQLISDKVCPYSLGYGAVCVDPFYSVAADLRYYKPGDVLYFPTALGAILPDGTKHSGYFVVRDSGGAILGRGRFDFFTGYYSPVDPNNILAKLGFAEPNNSIPYVLIDGPRAEQFRKSRFYPSIPGQSQNKAKQVPKSIH